MAFANYGGVVKWHHAGLQNLSRRFDSYRPCQKNPSPFGVRIFLLLEGGVEPGEGVGEREFPVAELFKPRGLKESRSDDGSSEADSTAPASLS